MVTRKNRMKQSRQLCSRRKTFNKIMNCKLINPELENVDPFSETLTTQEKKWIIEECRNNIMYFLSITQQGGTLTPKPTTASLRLIEELDTCS